MGIYSDFALDLSEQDDFKRKRKRKNLFDIDSELNIDDLDISQRQRDGIRKLDMINQLTVIRALREEQNLKNSNYGTLYARNDTHTVSDSEQMGKSDNMKINSHQTSTLYNENSKFNTLISSVFEEEGGYEDNIKKINQPTNMGIIQNTLDNFNRLHPDLKINKSLKQISKEDAKLIYKLDFYDQYGIDSINNTGNAKLLLHMFIMLKPSTALNLLHNSLNNYGYSCKKLLRKEMIPTLNQIDKDKKSEDFKEVLKSNYINYLKNSSEATKYRGWFSRIKRL